MYYFVVKTFLELESELRVYSEKRNARRQRKLLWKLRKQKVRRKDQENRRRAERRQKMEKGS